MQVEVTMPQMGESIAEGTITRWIKKVGEQVERDEPIFEISTDKVDAEIPSPASGVLSEIRNEEGDTVEVNSVVALIETDADAAATTAKPATPSEPAAGPPPEPPPHRPAPAERAETRGGKSPFVSPVVSRIAAEHGIDPASVPGTGARGRVTKKDILAYIDKRGEKRGEHGGEALPPVAASGGARPAFAPGTDVVRERMSVMRQKIAEHMIASRRTSAHVHSVFEIDMTHISRLRGKFKQEYLERHGVRLSFMAFFIKAACDALRAWPIVNASLDGNEILYKRELNIGVAVALEWGLIVPVIRNADELSLAGLSKRVQDLAERARSKQLNPDEVQAGTFTITNPGQFGGLYGLPIINQPQVAILGIGGIEKRPVVIDDAIAIRSMMYMSMSYDHRVVDGAVADQFLARIKATLENFDESLL
jgi:2-oxoglutarate dehydrogenase E2 component (dihydrolipoamide succinyltransferase)